MNPLIKQRAENENKGGGITAGALALQLRENAEKVFPNGFLSTEALLDSVYGIELRNNLPLQYILGVDVLALGRCMSLVGSWGSSKSSLGWYIASLFLDYGGIVISIDTEHKQNPDQILGILGSKDKFEQVIYLKASDLDEMLKFLMYYSKEYIKSVPFKNIPMLFLVDSLNAVTSKDSVEKQVKGDDAAAYSGARNAGQIQETMRAFVPTYLDKNPILAVVINHQKIDLGTMAMPGRPQPTKEPGGVHKDFMYTWKLELRKAGSKKSVSGDVPYYRIRTGKTSLGGQRPPIIVAYKNYYGPDGMEYIYYDWDEALTNLLVAPTTSKIALKKVMHLVKVGNKFNSDTLKLKGVSASVMGAAIHADATLCESIKTDVLKIRVKRKIGEYKGSETGLVRIVDEPEEEADVPLIEDIEEETSE